MQRKKKEKTPKQKIQQRMRERERERNQLLVREKGMQLLVRMREKIGEEMNI